MTLTRKQSLFPRQIVQGFKYTHKQLNTKTVFKSCFCNDLPPAYTKHMLLFFWEQYIKKISFSRYRSHIQSMFRRNNRCKCAITRLSSKYFVIKSILWQRKKYASNLVDVAKCIFDVRTTIVITPSLMPFTSPNQCEKCLLKEEPRPRFSPYLFQLLSSCSINPPLPLEFALEMPIRGSEMTAAFCEASASSLQIIRHQTTFMMSWNFSCHAVLVLNFLLSKYRRRKRG